MVPNRPQGDPQQRVSCPNCHVNNFLGQAQCWQCHAPLSSLGGSGPQRASRPTVSAMPPPSMYPQPPLPQQPPLLQQSRPIAAERAASARPHTLLLVGIAMLTFAIVLLASRSHSGSPLPTSSLPNSPSHSSEETRETPASSPDISVPSALPDNQVPATPNPQTAITPGTSGDPLEQAARRAVSREAPNIGLPPPPAVSPDGKVHLRSGGTITADEWNAARNKLKDSPLLKEPPAAPPF